MYKRDFDALDTDHTGLLEYAEVANLLALQLGSQPSAEAVTEFLGELDTDHDGACSFPEYMAGLLGTKNWSVAQD